MPIIMNSEMSIQLQLMVSDTACPIAARLVSLSGETQKRGKNNLVTLRSSQIPGSGERSTEQ